MSVSPFIEVHLQLSGDAGGWTDVSDDVRLAGSGMQFGYGLPGVSPVDRVAHTGTFTFALDNSEFNSDAREGYYSPDHVNCRPGFRSGIGVRVAITYAGTIYYKWRGRIDAIAPLPGVDAARHVLCHAVDWMNEAAEFRLKGIPVQLDKTGDEILTTILATMPIQPPSTSLQVGLDTYAYALDQSQDEKATALSEFSRIAHSGLDLIYLKSTSAASPTDAGGSQLVFENRHHRASLASNSIELDDTIIDGLEAIRDRSEILNTIRITVRPRHVDLSVEILFNLDNTTTIVDAANGSPLTLIAPYRDPAQTGLRIGGYDMVTPVATTDYTAISAKNGVSDLTTYLQLTVAFGANSATITIRNTHPTHKARITKLQLRGKALRAFQAEAVTLEAEDTDSQDQYGERSLSLEMPYQSSLDVGRGAAETLLRQYVDPRTGIRQVRFMANDSDALMLAALAGDISTRVGVTETMTGFTGSVEYLDQSQETTQGSVNFRFNTNVQKYAQGFKANPGDILRVEFYMRRAGTPTGSIWVTLESDAAGDPSGTVLATSVQHRSMDIPTIDSWVSFPFVVPYANPSSATQYHMVLQSDSPLSTSHFFPLAAVTLVSTSYLNGNLQRYNGSAWFDDGDAMFRIYVESATATRGYFINAVDFEVREPDLLTCRWKLAPADREQYWVVGVSAIGVNNRVAYI